MIFEMNSLKNTVLAYSYLKLLFNIFLSFALFSSPKCSTRSGKNRVFDCLPVQANMTDYEFHAW